MSKYDDAQVPKTPAAPYMVFRYRGGARRVVRVGDIDGW